MSAIFVWHVHDTHYEITKQRVIKETPCKIRVFGPEFGSSRQQQREWLANRDDCYATFEEARAALVYLLNVEVEYHKSQAHKARTALGDAKTLKEAKPCHD